MSVYQNYLNMIPPISTMFALFQVSLYMSSNYFSITKDEDVHVSIDKVYHKKEIWRIFIAHFYHFGITHLLINVILLVSTGRMLEEKIRKRAMIAMILGLGVLSNIFYLILSYYVCKNIPESSNHNCAYGFSKVLLGLKLVSIYIQEPRYFRYDFFFGLIPINAEGTLWSILLDIIIQEIIIGPDTCLGGVIAAFLSSIVVLFLLLHSNPANVIRSKQE